MAILRRATYTGIDDVMAAFDSINKGRYAFSIWHTERDIAFQWPNEDIDKGRAFLEENLQALEQTENDELFYLKFHPANKVKDFIDKKTPVISMTPFRVKELGEGKSGGQVNGVSDYSGYRQNFEIQQAIKELPDKFKTHLEPIEARLTALEEYEPEGEVLTEEDQVKKYIGYVGQISGVLSDPAVLSGIQNILKMFLPGLVAAPIVPQQISGVTKEKKISSPEPAEPINEDLLNASLTRLHNQGCRIDKDLALLADLAETNRPYFDMMLQTLRANEK